MAINIRTNQKIITGRIKKYVNIYIFPFSGALRFKKNKKLWRDYLIPIKKKKENVSENIDKILY